jgi:hypothetical protein
MYTAAFTNPGGEIGRSIVRCGSGNYWARGIHAVSFPALANRRRIGASDRRRDMRHRVFRHSAVGRWPVKALARRGLTLERVRDCGQGGNYPAFPSFELGQSGAASGNVNIIYISPATREGEDSHAKREPRRRSIREQ